MVWPGMPFPEQPWYDKAAAQSAFRGTRGAVDGKPQPPAGRGPCGVGETGAGVRACCWCKHLLAEARDVGGPGNLGGGRRGVHGYTVTVRAMEGIAKV